MGAAPDSDKRGWRNLRSLLGGLGAFIPVSGLVAAGAQGDEVLCTIGPALTPVHEVVNLHSCQ